MNFSQKKSRIRASANLLRILLDHPLDGPLHESVGFMKTRVHLAKIPESSSGERRPFGERFVSETRQFFLTSSLAGWQRRMRAFRLTKIVFQSLSPAEKTPPVLCSSPDEEKSPSSDQTELPHVFSLTVFRHLLHILVRSGSEPYWGWRFSKRERQRFKTFASKRSQSDSIGIKCSNTHEAVRI